ncbi:hypothetical protein PKHYL_04240 [Psychrobacter sp. KH172YL61]|nr:hypothetical protein PKHYL_04240 [Psychrobacter sp. KH172YL61]
MLILGAAILTIIARTAIVTISSIKVNPKLAVLSEVGRLFIDAFTSNPLFSTANVCL